jgi:hypothetical protein
MRSRARTLQSPHAGIRGKAGRIGTLRNHDGGSAGRLAVTMDTITDAMALVGQHGVYCQSQRWPGKPVMDIQLIMKGLTDAKELIQSVMEELKRSSG